MEAGKRVGAVQGNRTRTALGGFWDFVTRLNQTVIL
jgi:hypothetical protein